MTAFPTSYQNLAADLVSKTHDDSRIVRGSIYRQKKRGVTNVYIKVPVGAIRKSVFLGADSNPETAKKISEAKAASARARERRRDLSVLEGLGLIPAAAISGHVVDAMAWHGLFRNGGVLVGTLAYQCYPLTLGWTLPSTILATDDADLAAAHVAIRADSDADMITILTEADASFQSLPGLDPGAPACRYRNADGYVVDLITPTRHKQERQPVVLDGLGAGATALQYLAWLIADAIPGVLPFGSGVPVTIPRVERFAVHKLILSQRRTHDQAKAQKDLEQARALIEAVETVRPGRVGDELQDALSRGRKGWRDPIGRAVRAGWPRDDWKNLPVFDGLRA